MGEGECVGCSFGILNLRILIIFFPIIFMQGGQTNSDKVGEASSQLHAFLLRRLGAEPHCPSV
jgi:hypothetical protein